MLPRMTIDELNTLSDEAFVQALGAIYEHSPWVARGVLGMRPFADGAALAQAMAGVVAAAGEAAQLALVRAHPDLAGKLARAGGLAPASAGEQAGLGLDRLSDDEFEEFDGLNRAYRERFGLPFVIAVKRQTRGSILGAFQARLLHTAEAERRTALAEIDAIASYRLAALLAG